MSPISYILISGVLGVAGQLILKQAMSGLGPLALRPDTIAAIILSLALNPLVLLGLIVYISGTFFWLLALSRVDLSYAYPFASLNYILVTVASWWLLGERPTPMRIAGVVGICVGVWAISRTPARTAAGKPAPSATASAAREGSAR